jgi:hypothetical protein
LETPLARKRKKSRAKKKTRAEKRTLEKGSSPPDIEGEDGVTKSTKKSSRTKESGEKGSGEKSAGKKTPKKKAAEKKAAEKKASGKKANGKTPSGKGSKRQVQRKRSPKTSDAGEVVPLDGPQEENVVEVSLDEVAEGVEADDLIAAAAALAEVPAPDGTPTTATATVMPDTSDVFDISLDDDEEEADREQLIAEALAFVEQEESGTAHEARVRPPEEGRDQAEVGESAQTEATSPTEGETPGESEDEEDDGSDAQGTPTMSPAAFSALSAFHTEGLAKVPEEIILDLGEATTDEQRDRLLAAALAHVEMQDAVYRVRTSSGLSRSRLKATSTYILLVVALIVAIVPPGFIVPAQPTRVTNADREYGIRVAMVLEAQQIEAFRVETQRLPDSLEEVPNGLPGIRFVKSGARLYQLIAYLPSGEAIVYDSEALTADFQRIARVWAPSSPGI